MRFILGVLLALWFTPVSAQFNGCPAGFCSPKSSGTVGPPTVTTQAIFVAASGGGSSTYTWSSVSIGTAFSTRRVIGITGSSSGATFVSCTIGGINCDVSQINGTDGTQEVIYIISAVVPTGTTANFVINWSSGQFGGGRLFVYTCDNSLLGSATPITGYNTQASATSATATTTTLSNGFVIVYMNGIGGTSTAPSVSASSETITQDFSYSGASYAGNANGVTASGSNSATLTWTGSTQSNMILAAWR